MGSNQSAQERSSQFHRPSQQPRSQHLGEGDDDEDEETLHISISNKMVERIVEDANIAASPTTKESLSSSPVDSRDNLIMEKLRTLDDKHSERWGLTVGELDALVGRIERRTKNMINSEPVCPQCRQAVLDCYAEAEASHGDYTKCWGTISAFNACVRSETSRRLAARRRRDAAESARRERHVALARENVLRDLAPPPPQKPCTFEQATS